MRKAAWFSSVMTQRSIQLPHHTSARRAARSMAIARTQHVDIVLVNVALTALVLLVVVVLITPFTGAG